MSELSTSGSYERTDRPYYSRSADGSKGINVSWKSLRIMTLLIFCLMTGAAVNGHAAPSGEYLLKAGFLYHFAKFIDWPEEAFADEQSPMILGVLGVDPFDGALDSIDGKTVRATKILVVKRFAGIADLEPCHILFISRSEQGQAEKILQQLEGTSVLTVSDLDRFARRGGMIRLIKVDNKIRFAINLKVAESAGLVVSSRLLRLANIVESKQVGGQ